MNKVKNETRRELQARGVEENFVSKGSLEGNLEGKFEALG